MTRLVSVSEYARRMNVNEETVRRLARRGAIPACKVGNRIWRIDPEGPLPQREPIIKPERGEYVR